MMKGIVITTENQMRVESFGEPLYRSVGATVGGYIEIVHPKRLPFPYCMIVDEEGLIKNLPVNLSGCWFYGTEEHGAPIVGDLVIMKDGFCNGEPDIVGLEDDDVKNLTDWLKTQPIVANL